MQQHPYEGDRPMGESYRNDRYDDNRGYRGGYGNEYPENLGNNRQYGQPWARPDIGGEEYDSGGRGYPQQWRGGQRYETGESGRGWSRPRYEEQRGYGRGWEGSSEQYGNASGYDRETPEWSSNQNQNQSQNRNWGNWNQGGEYSRRHGGSYSNESDMDYRRAEQVTTQPYYGRSEERNRPEQYRQMGGSNYPGRSAIGEPEYTSRQGNYGGAGSQYGGDMNQGNAGYGTPGYGNTGYGGSMGQGNPGEYGTMNQNIRGGRGDLSGSYIGERGWQGPHEGKGPKGYKRSDDRIKEDVCENMSRNSQLDAGDIEVQVSEGEVTLTGTVDSRQAKHLAEDLAENCSGVKDVLNQLRVRQESEQETASHQHSGNGQGVTTTASGLGTQQESKGKSK